MLATGIRFLGVTSRALRGFVASIVLFALTALASAGGDPWADEIVSYDASGGSPAYGASTSVLGPPERFTGEGIFPSVVSGFNPPFGTNEIVSIGPGGSIEVRFDPPVVDDPANPFGIDLLVFGNAFFLDDGGTIGGVAAEGGIVRVSADGETWHLVPGAQADGAFPTIGYGDSGPYDDVPGSIETDFTKPVDPALTIDDFVGLDHDEAVALYAGSGGGAPIDLASVGLASIAWVRIENPAGAESPIEIDAFADVAPLAAPADLDGNGTVGFGDLTMLLIAWGPCEEKPAPCAADLDGNDNVGFADLTALLLAWGS